jgi:hypothetical protein
MVQRLMPACQRTIQRMNVAARATMTTCHGSNEKTGVSRKTAAELTASAFALALLVSTPLAQAAELTDADDQITAGAFFADQTNNTIRDINGRSYTRISDTPPYNYRDDLGNVWSPAVLYYYGNLAYGVLIGPAGQIWDGGVSVTTSLPAYVYRVGNGLL